EAEGDRALDEEFERSAGALQVVVEAEERDQSAAEEEAADEGGLGFEDPADERFDEEQCAERREEAGDDRNAAEAGYWLAVNLAAGGDAIDPAEAVREVAH